MLQQNMRVEPRMHRFQAEQMDKLDLPARDVTRSPDSTLSHREVESVHLALENVFAARVLPQLAEQHRCESARALPSTGAIWHAAMGTAEQLAHLLVAADPSGTARFIDSLLEQGAGFDALSLEVFEPTQLHLGKLWDADVCDEFRLTIGLARLQLEFRRVSAALPSVHVCRPDHSVLVCSEADEAHSMGVAMASDAFERDGWDVTCQCATSDECLSDLVHRQWFDILNLAQSGAVYRGRLASLRSTIDAVRAKSLNSSLIVIVAGRCFVEQPYLSRVVHANAAGRSALETVAVAARLLQASRSLASSQQVDCIKPEPAGVT